VWPGGGAARRECAERANANDANQVAKERAMGSFVGSLVTSSWGARLKHGVRAAMPHYGRHHDLAR
jgi:hypothetical protein